MWTSRIPAVVLQPRSDVVEPPGSVFASGVWRESAAQVSWCWRMRRNLHPISVIVPGWNSEGPCSSQRWRKAAWRGQTVIQQMSGTRNSFCFGLNLVLSPYPGGSCSDPLSSESGKPLSWSLVWPWEPADVKTVWNPPLDVSSLLFTPIVATFFLWFSALQVTTEDFVLTITIIKIKIFTTLNKNVCEHYWKNLNEMKNININ